jgi:hypothetical protein
MLPIAASKVEEMEDRMSIAEPFAIVAITKYHAMK